MSTMLSNPFSALDGASFNPASFSVSVCIVDQADEAQLFPPAHVTCTYIAHTPVGPEARMVLWKESRS